MLNAYFGRLVPLLEGLAATPPDHRRRAHGRLRGRSRGADPRAGRARAFSSSEWPTNRPRPRRLASLRVGVNSGEVHAGLVGGARGPRKHGFVGDVVNLAARLQADAPVGGVLIGEDTFRRLGGRAVVELPPLRVKGKEEPVGHVLRRVERRISSS